MEGYRGYTFGKKPLLLTEFVVLESDDHVKDEHEIFENVMDQKITEMIEHQDGADARRELFHSFQQMNMGRRTWLYAKVYSCRKRKCIINAFFSPRGRLWVNGKAVLIQTFDWQKQYMYRRIWKRDPIIFCWNFILPRDTILFFCNYWITDSK